MPISHHVAAQSTFGKVETGKYSFLDDLYTTDDTEKPMSGGIFIYEKSPEDFEYTYSYDELKIMLEGEMTLKDKATGEVKLVKAGDVVKIPKGTTVLFNSPTSGKAFYVGQRAYRAF
ncbi:uncharacterized protein STEHIDRAFT_117908 [Stereum hirsutum FP-91666 SS1]|uniref:uncharacterized protein n=1 Tax=Stereum hirsutum (strain FP-91666) TaxID=721885 RepID=UPI000440DE06|nr:uncharacterized protein STEHIDRAFT_117908 [Stereum hirsutum FP-91666 SS1]EIM90571.1 hypothetical protein STEHIDRAFT_117908 [Stereum hirsutum FP-91666 SS1]